MGLDRAQGSAETSECSIQSGFRRLAEETEYQRNRFSQLGQQRSKAC